MAQTRTLHGWLDAHPRSISLIGGIALFVLTLPAQAVLLIGNSPAGNAHNDVFSTQWNAVQFTQGQSRLHAQLYRLAGAQRWRWRRWTGVGTLRRNRNKRDRWFIDRVTRDERSGNQFLHQYHFFVE